MRIRARKRRSRRRKRRVKGQENERLKKIGLVSTGNEMIKSSRK